MNALFEEVCRRFPEVKPLLSDEHREEPYNVMHEIVGWLRSLQESQITPNLAQRLREFRDWCELHPRGETASNDIYTIFVVGFYEGLFAEAVTRRLIPTLVSKDDLIHNAEYLQTWVGTQNYQLALEQY
jgi:hypothetical protein